MSSFEPWALRYLTDPLYKELISLIELEPDESTLLQNDNGIKVYGWDESFETT